MNVEMGVQMNGRKYPLYLLLCVGVFAFSNSSKGSDFTPEPPKPDGVLVEFIDGPNDHFADRDRLHKKHGSRLRYRSASLLIDDVAPEDSRLISDQDYLLKLCRAYSQESIVKKCELNRVTPPPKSKNSPRVSTPPIGSQSLDSCPRPPNDFPEVKNQISAAMEAVKSREKCELVETSGGKSLRDGLSPFWSQEYIGGPMADRKN